MKRLLIPLLTLALSAVSGAALAGNVQHAMGRTTTPDTPQRIVVLTTEGTEAVLALGIKPVGAANGRAVNARGSVWYAHVADRLDGVEPLGEERAVNLEQIAALEPDLILGNRQRHEGVYDQLSAIAPTVLSTRLRGDWRKNFELYAEALGRKDEGAAVLAAFDKRVAELSDALGAQKDETLSVIRFMPGQIRIYQRDSFSGDVLARLGIARPELQQEDSFVLKVGKESIPDMDGDRLVHFTYESGDGKATALARDIASDPLWQSLKAVQAGSVHAVDDVIWNTAGGILAAERMLDDVAKIYGVD
ncbi:ABC transporter substrate-binding protein [Nitratireductor sp. PBL-C9]|uniref:ABC transporter substrate-binding protein n=1 Tax=Nitratireductor sp. PBL-C9 TaxID=3435013 RepID=UPI003D7D768B